MKYYNIGLGVALLFTIILGIVLLNKVERLRSEIAILEGTTSGLDSRLNNFTNNILYELYQLKTEFHSEGKNFYDVGLRVTGFNQELDKVMVGVMFSLKEYSADDVISVVCSNKNANEAEEFPAVNIAGNVFLATIELDYQPDSRQSFRLTYVKKGTDSIESEFVSEIIPDDLLRNRILCKVEYTKEDSQFEYQFTISIQNSYLGNEMLKMESIQFKAMKQIGPDTYTETASLTEYIRSDSNLEYFSSVPIFVNFDNPEPGAINTTITMVDKMGIEYNFMTCFD